MPEFKLILLILLRSIQVLFFLFLAADYHLAAQSSFDQKIEKGIEIQQAEWFVGRDWDNLKLPEFGNQYESGYQNSRYTSVRANYPSTLAEASPFETKKGFIYQIKLRNNYSREVISISWEYVFRNPLTGELLGKHSFVSLKHLKPHAVEIVFAFSAVPPSQIIDVELLRRNPKNPYRESAVITTVAFSDGSILNFPSKEK